VAQHLHPDKEMLEETLDLVLVVEEEVLVVQDKQEIQQHQQEEMVVLVFNFPQHSEIQFQL
jgi:hypothetical protein